MPSPPRIFLSAGEASGDHYGAQIIDELRLQLAGHSVPSFTGLGGTEMQAVGQHRVVRAEDVAHMGITEVLRHMPYIYGQYRKLVTSIRQEKPDLAILIDFPDVNFRLARHLRAAGVPVIWFVSPQLWAWKRGRLRWVKKRIDRMLVIFPFEADFYRNRGVDARFVGHPLASLPLPTVTREAYAAEHGLDLAKPWVALLPGSRSREVLANLPAMLDAAALLSRAGHACEFLLPVASTLDPVWMANQTSHAPKWLHLVPDAREALLHARTAAVASGTATMQAAVIGTPFVVVYRVSELTFLLAKFLVRYPKEIPTPKDEHGNLAIAMPNLIAGRRIVPELINHSFTPEGLASALIPLLSDTPKREVQLHELKELRKKLLVPGSNADQEESTATRPASPIQRAVQEILPLLKSQPV